MVGGSDLYVYAVPGREDGLRFAFHTYGNPQVIVAMFAGAGNAQRFADVLRADGLAVHVMPSAQGTIL